VNQQISEEFFIMAAPLAGLGDSFEDICIYISISHL
jgi:hypothetical protein